MPTKGSDGGGDSATWAPEGELAERAPDGPRYRDAVEVGSGSMGRVLGVVDAHLGRRVAYKELRRNRTSPSARARFLREARITAQLQHPGIAPVYDLGQDENGVPWYTMRFVEGRTLRDALKDAAPAERLALLPRFADACHAVAYAHARGVVHRDLKPENILLGAFGETLVVDWGLAKRAGEDEPVDGGTTFGDPSDSSGTRVGTVLGTPSWMSPEQARGEIAAIDARTDVWSLGVILFEILTGERPFAGPTAEEILEKVRIGPIPRVSDRDPDAPTELAAVCARALRRNPDERYPTAAELATDVRAFLDGGWVRAYAYSPWERAARALVRHRLLVGTVIGCALLLAVVGTISYRRVIDERDRAQAAEATGRRNLAEAFAGKAAGALATGDLLQAELFAAAALDLDERPDARGILARTRATWRPAIAGGFGPEAGCRSVHGWSDGDRVVCAGPEGVSAWRLGTGEALWATPGDAVSAVVSPDGSRVAAQDPARVRILDGATGAVLAELPAVRRGANPQPAWRPDGAEVAFAYAGTVVYADRDGAPVGEAAVGGTVVGIAWRGDELVSASLDGRVARVDAAHRLLGRSDKLADAGLYAIAAGRDRVAVGTGSGAVVWLDPQALVPLREVAVHDGPVMALSIDPGGRWLATGGEDRTVRLVAVDGDPGFALAVAGTGDPALQFTTDDRLLIGAAGARGRAWALPADRPPSRIDGGGSGLTAVAWSVDGSVLATANGAGRVLLHERAGGGVTAIAVADTVVRDVVFGDAQTVVAATSTGVVAAFDRAGAPVATLLDRPVQLNLAVDRTRGQLYGTGYDGLLTRWEGWGPPVERFVGDPEQPLWEVVVSADGSVLAWADGEDEVTAVALPDRRPLWSRRFPVSPRAIALSPTGDRLAMSSADEDVEIVSLPDGRPLHRLVGPQNAIDDLEFSPDGALLVVSSWDQRAWVYDARQGTLRAILADHEHRVVDAEFSPDGRWLATASWDGTARIWAVAALSGPTAPIVRELAEAQAVRLDGARLVAVPP